MSIQFKKSMLASSLLVAMALAGNANAADAAAQTHLEARQEAQIQTSYSLNPYLRSTDLTVSVQGDKATLSGKVNDIVDKELAEQIALGTKGIKSVDNQIVLDPEYAPSPLASPDRSFGEVVDDATTTAAVKSKLLWNKHADGLSANVDTNRGKVTLTGTAHSKEAKDLAEKLARTTLGVKLVDNRLEIIAAKPKEDSEAKEESGTVGEAISDTWITTKVKSTFMYSTGVSSYDISVETKEGVVTLSGNVASAHERSLAIELAEALRGVKKVNAEALTAK